MARKIVRVVSRAADGQLKTKEYESVNDLQKLFEQIGIDDCSTDLSLRGLPLFRGLIGPISESKSEVLYESPDVFEYMTKEWSLTKNKRKRRNRAELEEAKAASEAAVASPVPIPKVHFGTPTTVPAVGSF